MSYRYPYLLSLLLLLAPLAALAQSVGINTSAPNASAALDIVSSTKGALLPRLTAGQRTGLLNPAQGLIVYQTDGSATGGPGTGFWYNQGTAAAPTWLRLTDGNGVSYDPTTGLQVGPGPVSTGTAATNVPGSVNGSYGPFRSDVNSARTETLYPAAYLTSLGLRAGPLTAIAYQMAVKNSTQPYANFTLALGQTPATSLGTTFATSGLTTVYTGSVTTPAAGQLLTLVFSGGPFSWDGTSSVLVQTCFQNATTSLGPDEVVGVVAANSRLFAAEATSQCAVPTGTSSPNRPNVAFAQPGGAYVLPPVAGTPGQVLTQQAGGNVAFLDPQWRQTGTDLYPNLLTSQVGIGTSSPQNPLDLGPGAGATPTDAATKKLAVYNNAGGTDFYGLGVSSGQLNVFASATPTGAPGLTLTNTGLVGIGTTGPTARLDVTSPAANADVAVLRSTGGYGQLLVTNGTTTTDLGATGGLGYAGTNSAGDFVLRTSATNRLYLQDGTGNVGVGTSGPAAKLDVNGTFKLGATGNVLTRVRKDVLALGSFTVAANSSNTAFITYGGTPPTQQAVVTISIDRDLGAGILIATPWIDNTGRVFLRFQNVTGTAITVPASNLNVAFTE